MATVTCLCTGAPQTPVSCFAVTKELFRSKSSKLETHVSNSQCFHGFSVVAMDTAHVNAQFWFLTDMIGTSSGTGKKGGVGSGKETLRLKSKGPATIQVVRSLLGSTSHLFVFRGTLSDIPVLENTNLSAIELFNFVLQETPILRFW